MTTPNSFVRFTKIILILTICFSAAAIPASAAPPANDNLANAVALNGASGTFNGTTAEATRESGEAPHTFSAETSVYRTVWFQWTATEAKPVTFEVTTAGFDAGMAIYTGGAYPLESVTFNNDTFGNRPRIELLAETGMTYRIVVGIYNDEIIAGGNFTLQWAQANKPTNNNFANALSVQNTSGIVAITNQNADSEPSEPIFGNGNTIWVNYTNTSAGDFSVTFTTSESNDVFLDSTISVFTGAALSSLSTVVKNNDLPATSRSRVTFLARAGVTYRIAVDSDVSAPPGNILLNWFITKPAYYTDFGTKIGTSGEIFYDESADIAVFRPAEGVWYHLDSSDGTFHAFQFGLNGDLPVPADYDGDGRTDYAVTRDAGGQKIWYIRNSFAENYTILQWGLAGDKAMPGDYDGDGRTDIAVFRPSTNVWYIWRSSDHQFFIKEFGLAGDIPVIGDFKGTPAGTDLAVFRPSNGFWYIFDGVNTIFVPFGTAGDKPVPADYDFDGKTDIAVFRPADGTWYLLQSRHNTFKFVRWGLAGDVPMVGDFDNNTNDPADFVVFRPSDRTWYMLTQEGFAVNYVQFGLSTDIPVSSYIP